MQVRYEMLRAPAQGEMTVTEACRAFGVSRQTFYMLRRAIDARGLVGLTERKRGRKGGPPWDRWRLDRLGTVLTVA
jgi:hypothetical protein